jgi:hypothetical protein
VLSKLAGIEVPHHFGELLVEPDGVSFWWFGSTNKPKC